MSRTDLNDVVRYRLLVTAALRLMGIWLIASRILPLVTQALMILWQDLIAPNFTGSPAGLWGNSPWFWGNIAQGILFLIAGLFLIIYARRLARRIIPIASGRCPGCDYDLGKAPPSRCPECGLDLSSLIVPIDPDPVQSPGKDSQ